MRCASFYQRLQRERSSETYVCSFESSVAIYTLILFCFFLCFHFDICENLNPGPGPQRRRQRHVPSPGRFHRSGGPRHRELRRGAERAGGRAGPPAAPPGAGRARAAGRAGARRHPRRPAASARGYVYSNSELEGIL